MTSPTLLDKDARGLGLAGGRSEATFQLRTPLRAERTWEKNASVIVETDRPAAGQSAGGDFPDLASVTATDVFLVTGVTQPVTQRYHCCDALPSMISPAGGMGPVMPASPTGTS